MGDVLKGAAIGMAAGVAAAWVMQQFQTAAAQGVKKARQSMGLPQPTIGPRADGRDPQEQQQGEPSAIRAATAVAERVLHRPIPKEHEETAGAIAHCGLGAFCGAAYGAAAELTPHVTAGHGTAFGAAVWLLADEIAVPALGLSLPPTKHPPSTHLFALSSHLVFGATTELLRRAMRDRM